MILTLNMEIGLITPPVGLNLYVINGIVKDVDQDRAVGALPFMLCLVLGIVLITSCFRRSQTWLPDYLMGPVR